MLADKNYNWIKTRTGDYMSTAKNKRLFMKISEQFDAISFEMYELKMMEEEYQGILKTAIEK